MKSKFITVVAAAAILTGCGTVPTQKMDATAGASLKDQTIARTTRDKPTFAAITAVKVMLGPLGAAAMASEGNKIVADYKIADPADRIASELIAALGDRHGAKAAAAPVRVTSNDTAEVATASKASGKYALDVETKNWSFSYFPSSYGQYRIAYQANARLIDTESKAVLAQGSCLHQPDDKSGAPTYDELLANDAARLKKELAVAADACVASLKGSMLAL